MAWYWAKSAFSHSANFRSAVIFGQFKKVDDPKEVNHALKMFMEHIAPERWEKVRSPTAKELKATTVLAMPMEEVSIKVGAGGPNDHPSDLNHPVWSGRLVIRQTTGEMIPDEHCFDHINTPDYSQAWGDRWVPRKS